MNIGLVVVAYNSGPDLVRLVDSAHDRRHHLHVELFLHSGHPSTVRACDDVLARTDTRLHRQGNIGISRSWNDGALNCWNRGADVVIVANDDIVFGPGDIHTMASEAAANPERFMVYCAGYHTGYDQPVESHSFSCFAWNRIAMDVIGCFDENFFPAYHEDCDYSWRRRLAGLPDGIICPDTQVVHAGSATIKRDPVRSEENHLTFSRNAAYYQHKWGGDVNHEVHRHPFDDARFDYRIAPESRHAPYPGHDRYNPVLAGGNYSELEHA